MRASAERPIALPARPLVAGETALRPWRDDDLPSLVDACQDPEIARWTSVPAPYGEADARAYLRERADLTRASLRAPFAIVAGVAGSAGAVGGEEGRLLGSISLIRFSWEHARAEVGYWLARPARGAGHATRAVGLICDWGMRELGLERIELMAATGNLASQRVAERCGFTREAVLRSHSRGGRGERQDMVVFGLLARERD